MLGLLLVDEVQLSDAPSVRGEQYMQTGTHALGLDNAVDESTGEAGKYLLSLGVAVGLSILLAVVRPSFGGLHDGCDVNNQQNDNGNGYAPRRTRHSQ